MSTARIVCLTSAVTRLTHMSGTVGNEAIVAREPVTAPTGERRNVACLSGNALRHVCVRAPGMRWLVGEYGLSGTLTLAQLNFLFHGGALTESTGREPTARVVEMGESIPLLRLLGGTLPDQILSGSLRVGPGILVCEENRDRLAAVLGAETLDGLPPLMPGESWIEAFQYSTYGVREREAELAERATDATDSKSDPRMLYTGQCVRSGAAFVHEFHLSDPTTVDVGCLLWSLELWQRSGGVVGGMGAKGHGRTETVILLDGVDQAANDCVGDYLRRARDRRERAQAWLRSAFGLDRESVPKKVTRRKRGETPTTEPLLSATEEAPG